MTSATTDPVAQALTGVWPFIMVISALLTFPASALLLWLYRRAVLRGMKESRIGGVPVADAATGTDSPAKPLQFVSLDTKPAPRATVPGPWAAAIVYLAAGAAYTLVMTVAWFLATHDFQIGPIKALFCFLDLLLACDAGSDSRRGTGPRTEDLDRARVCRDLRRADSRGART